MSNNKYIGIILAGIAAFFAGALYFKSRQERCSLPENFNRTLAVKKEDKYFLVFNSVVIISREVTKEQYDAFIAAHPSGSATGNVIDKFSSPPARYTYRDGSYFESTWEGDKYGRPIEITKEEYDFFKNKNSISSIVSDMQCI